ncbi:Uncharacterized conserved protein, implicated in type VI secretion and phage assembly [Tessaracoccus bendigoensis DSM 12906]|uniref:Uncharacterized conserved protein, implicated in type VI secretion and phage assembly n=1 Tax=Tessaracoccus bendigoensis DSM 12906 TaxID=1123357 RepID=A0A1M6GFP2_9ACTN|nr:phage baseplate assembly protein V [Tessaracoccus bendigoensis]SHJ08770.1 Uncharacterized conserved protein, implicated in type VI secretion and phage assembly [Tessaracoccus bendigoensis DSM 12906]
MIPGIAAIPTPTVTLAGRVLPPAELGTLGCIRVRFETSAPAACELQWDPGPIPELGDAITLTLEGELDQLFDGEVVSLVHVLGPNGRARLRVRAQDRARRLRAGFRVLAYTEVTVADVVRRLAAEHGLGSSAEEQGPLWPRVMQHGESDLAFIDRLASRASLWWQVEGGELRLRGWTGGPERNARWGEELVEAEITHSDTPPRTVRASGWDPVERTVFDGTPVGEGEVRFLAAGVLAGSEHAARAARVVVDRSGTARLSLRAVLRGDSGWRPGVKVHVAAVPGTPTEAFVLTSVEHVLDQATGYLCVATSVPPPDPPPQPADGCGFTQAVVLEVSDPDGMGRVRCSFPGWDGAESEWLPVVTAGAGGGKGLTCQPDVGDAVVVLYALDDPGRGVVLGGLFADGAPADRAGVRDGAVRQLAWRTPDGQEIRLNRDGDTVVVTNGAGSYLELGADEVRLHAETNLTLEAPGRTIVVRADRIDFERG